MNEIEQRFTFHPAASYKTMELHQEVRDHHRVMAAFIVAHVPDSRERSLALTKLQESMWCNAAVAYRNEEE